MSVKFSYFHVWSWFEYVSGCTRFTDGAALCRWNTYFRITYESTSRQCVIVSLVGASGAEGYSYVLTRLYRACDLGLRIAFQDRHKLWQTSREVGSTQDSGQSVLLNSNPSELNIESYRKAICCVYILSVPWNVLSLFEQFFIHFLYLGL